MMIAMGSDQGPAGPNWICRDIQPLRLQENNSYLQQAGIFALGPAGSN